MRRWQFAALLSLSAIGWTWIEAATRSNPSVASEVEEVEARPRNARFALRFDGVDDIVTVPDVPSLNPVTAMTLEYWVKFDQVSHPQWNVLKDDGGPFRQTGLGMAGPLTSAPGNRFRAHVGVVAGYAFFDGATEVQPETWYHVATTYDGSTLKLYVNGELDGSMTVDSPMVSYPVPLTMGDNPEPYPLDGMLDEVRLWDVARSEKEIRRFMGRTMRNAPTGLIGHWPLDEGVGDVAIDRSGLGHHGQLGVVFGPDVSDPQWSEETAPIR